MHRRHFLLICLSCLPGFLIAQSCNGGVEENIYQAPPRHTNIILIGATGDLARKYLWNALFDLFSQNFVKGL